MINRTPHSPTDALRYTVCRLRYGQLTSRLDGDRRGFDSRGEVSARAPGRRSNRYCRPTAGRRTGSSMVERESSATLRRLPPRSTSGGAPEIKVPWCGRAAGVPAGGASQRLGSNPSQSMDRRGRRSHVPLRAVAALPGSASPPPVSHQTTQRSSSARTRALTVRGDLGFGHRPSLSVPPTASSDNARRLFRGGLHSTVDVRVTGRASLPLMATTTGQPTASVTVRSGPGSGTLTRAWRGSNPLAGLWYSCRQLRGCRSKAHYQTQKPPPVACSRRGGRPPQPPSNGGRPARSWCTA